ncbi:MAG: regulatory protein GemA [Spirochaetota bacterium]
MARPNMSRGKLIQLIHVAKKQLALADENYRTLIAEVKQGATSCTELNLFQLGELYKLLKACGFRPVKKIPDRAPKKREGDWATQEQLYYIRGLWQLSARNPSEQSLCRMCKRITGIDMIQWLDNDGANKLILALRDITKKAGYDPDTVPRP